MERENDKEVYQPKPLRPACTIYFMPRGMPWGGSTPYIRIHAETKERAMQVGYETRPSFHPRTIILGE